ncbi:carbohydrate-binding WSC, partial [Obelidium mucronatum]
YRYVDCYQDSKEKRLLRNKLSGKGGMSLELCASLATLAGYTIFGVEYSSECWADIKFGNNHPVSSESCNMYCDGKTSQICGGNGALSVF